MSEWKIALCRVYRNDKNDPWLCRIADIEDGKLKKWEEKYGLNSFYYTEKNNQNMPDVGEYGIWKWHIINEVSDKLQTETYYESLVPIEIIPISQAKSLEEIVEYLKNGISGVLHSKKVFFCYPYGNWFLGLLCNRSQLQTTNNEWKLKNDVYTLPECKISQNEKISDCLNGNRVIFFDRLEMKPIEDHKVQSPKDIIKERIQELFRRYLKDNETRKNRQLCVKILETKNCYQTIVEGLIEDLKITPQEARCAVDAFLDNIKKNIVKVELDEKILEQCIRSNPTLVEYCTKLGREFRQKQEKDEIEEQRKKLNEYTARFQQIVSKMNQLDQLQTVDEQRTIEQQKLELSRLEDIIQALQSRIEEKKENVWGLLRELGEISPEFSGFMFADRTTTAGIGKPSAFIEGQLCTAECEKQDDGSVGILQDNLKDMGIRSETALFLSAFLCSAYWLKMPLLLAGPCGEQIAEVLSISLLNRRADVLDCSSEFSPTDLERAMENEKNILIVKTPFHGVWFDHLAYRLMPAAKCIIFLCPNADELCIEPQGIFTYLTPLVTDVFLGEIKDLSYEDFYMGEPDAKFKEPESNGEKHLKKSALFKKLKVHPFGVRKIRKLIFTMQSFLAQKEENTAELEMLFGLFPYAWLTRQMQVIQEEVSSCKLIEAYWKTAE